MATAKKLSKGVIYARYSSERQNEQSIAGQVEECKKYASDNDIKIVGICSEKTTNIPMINTALKAGFKNLREDELNS